jgi:hypothetical protein
MPVERRSKKLGKLLLFQAFETARREGRGGRDGRIATL